MTRSTSDAAVCCSRASFSSRVRRATSPCSPATEGVVRDARFDALRSLGFDAFGRRAWARLPLTLERRFMTPPWAHRGILAGPGSTPEVRALSYTWGSPLALLIFSDKKKNPEPARRMLPRRPNVDKPKQDNAGDQHHPKLQVSIQQRNVGDQPLSHLPSPP